MAFADTAPYAADSLHGAIDPSQSSSHSFWSVRRSLSASSASSIISAHYIADDTAQHQQHDSQERSTSLPNPAPNMPRLKPIDDAALDPANRRSSGRARKPTAKIEALTGTKFYPSDSAKGRRMGSTSQSPGPSADSSFSTPISPQSEATPYGTQDPTSPSTISVNLDASIEQGKDATGIEPNGPQSPPDTAASLVRRERKPTQRALEMNETAPKTRRRRRTKAEMAAARLSASLSEASATPEAQTKGKVKIVHSTQRGERSSERAKPSLTPPQLTEPRRGEHVAATYSTNGNSPPPTSKIEVFLTRGEGGQLQFGWREPASTAEHKSTESSPTVPRRRGRPPGSGRGRPRLPTRQRSIPAPKHGSSEPNLMPPKSRRITGEEQHELPKRRARRSAVNYAELDSASLDLSTDETPEEEPTTPKRSLRAKRTRDIGSEPTSLNDSSPASTPGGRRLRLRQPIAPTESVNGFTDSDSEPAEARKPTRGRPARRGKHATPVSVQPVVAPAKKRPASPPEEERPRKSLKLKLRVPGLKAPSKLRFSINSQDVKEESATLVPAETAASPVNEPAYAPKNLTKTQVKDKSAEEVIQRPKPSETIIAPVKLSRRAQAKADAKALGKVRQATGPSNHDLLRETTYGGAAAHYAPSVGLLRPAVDCGLFCLPESSRILAFAKIAAESMDSDEEETSDGGRNPELLGKWLMKGGSHCICNKTTQAHDATESESLEGPGSSRDNASSVQGATAPPLNEDVAAVVPENTVLPLSIPPVNSVMSKSEGRRVSAFYNVLASSTSPYTSSRGSPAATSQRQSDSASPRKSDMSPAPGLHSTAAYAQAEVGNTARSSTGSSEERQRWDNQALERVRREAGDLGLPIPLDMPYLQIKSLLERHKKERSNATSEHSSTSGTRQASFQLVEESAAAAAESSPAASTSYKDAHGSPPRSTILDDSEDRLLQIIGDSFKATMSRNNPVLGESQSIIGSPDDIRGKSRGHGAVVKSRRSSSGARPRRGPSNPAFEDNLRRIVHG